MYDFYVFLDKNGDIYEKFGKESNYIGKMKFNHDLHLYKIDSIDEYLETIYNNKTSIVSDFTNTLRIKKNNSIRINENVANHLLTYIEDDSELYICSWITKDKILDWGSNDLQLYLDFVSKNSIFPNHQNYIFCTGDRVAKRYFVNSLNRICGKVKFIIDDSILNLVKYYDITLPINMNTIPQFILYNPKMKSIDKIYNEICSHIKNINRCTLFHRLLIIKNLKILDKKCHSIYS